LVYDAPHIAAHVQHAHHGIPCGYMPGVTC
jgi:hypothetical protein